MFNRTDYRKGLVAVLLSACLLTPSCRREPLVVAAPEPDGRLDVSFVLDVPSADTKVSSPSAGDEQRVNRWALYVYDSSGGQVARGWTSSSGGMDVFLNQGTYRVVALVNYPDSGASAFNPDGDYSRTDLLGRAASLGQNAVSSLMMVADQEVTVSSSGTKQVAVSRHVARVGVVGITRQNGSNNAFNSASFTVTGIFVDNVLVSSRYDGVPTSAQTASGDSWYRKMGADGTDTALNALLVENGLSIGLSAGQTHSVSHYFYVYPNPVEADSRSVSAWSPRRTRLVIRADVGGLTCYYPVTMPVMAANASYNVSVTVSDYGAGDPEQDVPLSMQVAISSSVAGWSGPVQVNETS